MKTNFRTIITAVLFSVVSGLILATAMSLSPLFFIIPLLVMSFVPLPDMVGTLSATVYQEVWTKKVVEEINKAESASFLDGIEDFSRYVSAVGDEMQVIHMVYMGVLPDVLINNTTYPIPLQTLEQEDIPIQLDNYKTKQTPITDDELYALSYDKIATVKNKHARAIMKAKHAKAIHALAPSGNTAKMPVLVTSGDEDGATGRKKMVWEDLLKLKREADNLEIPKEGRRLVLCSDHENDLLALDQKFKEQYFNPVTGKVYKQLGFEFYSYHNNPYYNPSTKAKLSYGAVPAGTDQEASVFFSLERAAKATGWTKMYYAEAKNDPEYQRNRMNFRHHFIVTPTREEARGAIVSANV